MSDPVTALGQARFDGGIARITELGPLGMITLRGDLADKALIKAAKEAGGVNVPQTRTILSQGDNAIAWMSPDELLIMTDYASVRQRTQDLSDKLAKQHALAVNVSDARAVFEVSGPHARDVMAKLAPVDLAQGQFEPGMFRRTRLAQVAAAFWMTDEQTFRVVCFRSVAQYVFDVLSVAAQASSEVHKAD
ncbi:sarcosine oxidase subunit gamma [Sulfitobacter sp. S190]|uniref:sarcosine oxidase subunit gamma n=1 Tax=Sulfitobacter sp. S190 TaxID=2867022 RepID=UPI0021A55E9C|nr:sarcosine oxidase subunit gamma family protein [Sulfitobacter sp. S190]UWR21345.1 sarcosine oxidase subunit gamma [Sulfitobacter sp. S190]